VNETQPSPELVKAIRKVASTAVTTDQVVAIARAVHLAVEDQPVGVHQDGKKRIDWPTRVFSLALQLTRKGK